MILYLCLPAPAIKSDRQGRTHSQAQEYSRNLDMCGIGLCVELGLNLHFPFRS